MEITGMAPPPEQMNRLRGIPVAKKKKRGSQGIIIRSDSPPTGVKAEVSHILYGLHWQYQKRILDILKIVTDTPKWDVVRTIVLDIQNEQIEATRVLVGQRIQDHLIRRDQEDEENGSGIE